MQFSLRCDEGIWELTDHEKEVTSLSIYWEIMAKFHMVPIDYNGFWSSFTPKNRHVGDVSQTRGWSVYSSVPSYMIHKMVTTTVFTCLESLAPWGL